MIAQTKTNWRKTKLGDICQIKTGKTDSQNAVKNGIYPLFDRSATIKRSDKFLFDTSAIILPGEGKDFVPQFYEGKFNLHQRVYAIYCDETKRCEDLNLRFLYYFLLLNREYFAQTATGATVKSLRLPIIADCPVVLPPFPTQEKIANILSTYDNLIKNNTKRIKILEEMAQTIYKEWFIENSKIKNQNVKLSEIVKPQYGYTESASNEQIGPKYLRGTDINKNSYIDWSNVPYCKISDEDKKKYQLQKGDIVIIRMADPGKIGIVEQNVDAVFASYLIRLKITDNRISPYYLFYFLNSEQYQNYIQGASDGTTRKSASADIVTRTNIIVSPKELIDKFEEKISLLRVELNNLLVQNSNLRQARDLLLPKLVNGEIEVR